MVYATNTTFSSRCVQMDPQQLPKMIKMYSICNKFVMQKSVGEDTTPLGSLRVKMCLICIGLPQYYIRKRFSCTVVADIFARLLIPGIVFMVREETSACSIRLHTLIRL